MTEVILYTTEDGRSQIKLRAQVHTVWLTQLEMAELFDATKQNISLHLKNIFEDGELSRAATTEKSSVVQSKDKSSVSGHASVDHFRDATKMIVRGKLWASDHFRGATKMVGPGKNRRRHHDGR